MVFLFPKSRLFPSNARLFLACYRKLNFIKKSLGRWHSYRYEEARSTYLGMKIEKVSNAEFEGVILDSDNYDGESII